jgi:site-specific DNA-methyltransferase (adenine-specific)
VGYQRNYQSAVSAAWAIRGAAKQADTTHKVETERTMRTETIGKAVLYLGDCREVELPSVGGLVTDPPYGIGDKMQGGTWGAAEKYADFRAWDIAPDTETLASFVAKAHHAIIWGGNYFDLPPSRCWLSWSKTNSVQTMADFELAWTNLDKPCKQWHGPVGKHEFGHPTEKPHSLMKWCLQQLGECSSVLDPYMGTGTTGVACADQDRTFIGVEISERYFDIACKRIEAAYAQLRLFA